MPEEVPKGVIKIIELVGTSPSSFSDAVRNAVSTAAQTLRNITGVDVLSSNATVENGEISLYKVQVKIAFVLDSGADAGADSSADD